LHFLVSSQHHPSLQDYKHHYLTFLCFDTSVTVRRNWK